MTTIKINRRTIKKNPNAGRYQYPAFRGRTSTIKYVHCQDIFEDAIRKAKLKEVSYCMTSQNGNMDRNGTWWFAYTYDVHNVDPTPIVEALQSLGISSHEILVSINNHYDRVYSMIPEPDYLYEYRKTKVKCKHCGVSSLHSDYYDDCLWDGDNEIYVSNICPNCNTSGAVDLEYEKIEEVVK